MLLSLITACHSCAYFSYNKRTEVRLGGFPSFCMPRVLGEASPSVHDCYCLYLFAYYTVSSFDKCGFLNFASFIFKLLVLLLDSREIFKYQFAEVMTGSGVSYFFCAQYSRRSCVVMYLLCSFLCLLFCTNRFTVYRLRYL